MINTREEFEQSVKEIDKLNKRVTEIRNERKQFIQRFKPEGVKELVLGSWDCPDSPFGLCAYDPYSDVSLDDCVFCHEPDERK